MHKENVEKADDFYFSDTCVSFMALPILADEQKDREIKAGKRHSSPIKQAVHKVLANNDLVIIKVGVFAS